MIQPRINLITLGVKDIKKSVKFYSEGLGFKLSSASQDDVAFFHMNGTVLALFPRKSLAEDAQVKNDGEGFDGVTLAQNVPKKEMVAEILKQAEAAGATIKKAAQDVFWGGHSGYFADPDGHLWEVAWNPHFKFKEDGHLELP